MQDIVHADPLPPRFNTEHLSQWRKTFMDQAERVITWRFWFVPAMSVGALMCVIAAFDPFLPFWFITACAAGTALCAILYGLGAYANRYLSTEALRSRRIIIHSDFVYADILRNHRLSRERKNAEHIINEIHARLRDEQNLVENTRVHLRGWKAFKVFLVVAIILCAIAAFVLNGARSFSLQNLLHLLPLLVVAGALLLSCCQDTKLAQELDKAHAAPAVADWEFQRSCDAREVIDKDENVLLLKTVRQMLQTATRFD